MTLCSSHTLVETPIRISINYISVRRYMDGFRFAMAGNQPCLNLYFPSWTLDTPSKFVGAIVLVFLLAFGTEGVSKFRHVVSQRRPTRQSSRRTRQAMISALHGFQALLGYVVMLATMTFSVEILLAVVAGLSTGYYYFFAGEVGLEGHVTTNPCCNFMQDESNEHEQQQQQQQQLHQLQACSDTGMTTGLLSVPPGSNIEPRLEGV
jgi:Ctr copper transporter family